MSAIQNETVSKMEKISISLENDDLNSKQNKKSKKKYCLVNFNNDFLGLIFNYLSLIDAFHLGITCHRLYDLFQASCKVRKSLILINGQKTYFLVAEEKFTDRKLNEDQFTNRFNTIRLLKKRNNNQQLNIIRKLFSTLPNLTYLEVSSSLTGSDLYFLISALNNLSSLVTLKLYLSFDDNPLMMLGDLHSFLEPTVSSSEQVQLQLPALKHFTLGLKAGYIISKSVGPGLFGLRNPEPDNTLTPLFASIIPTQPLSTFHFYNESSLSSTCTLIQNYIAFTPLVAGSSNVQIALHLENFNVEEKNKIARMVFNGDDKVKKALSYITYFQADFFVYPVINKLLPMLQNLRRLHVIFSVYADTEYPAMLTTLSALPHLTALHTCFMAMIANNYMGKGERFWSRPSPLTVLPSVTSLSLVYATSVHDDIVEQLHLDHVFPRLTNFKVYFEQLTCLHCGYRQGMRKSDDIYQKCGRALTRLLPGSLPSTVNQIELQFSFIDSSIYFNSLENLFEGKRSEKVE